MNKIEEDPEFQKRYEKGLKRMFILYSIWIIITGSILIFFVPRTIPSWQISLFCWLLSIIGITLILPWLVDKIWKN